MSKYENLAFIGTHAGKVTFTGVMKAQTYVEMLRTEEVSVNSSAQRSLMPGKNRESTKDLIETNAVLKTLRMKNFLKFTDRLMSNAENGKSDEGFLGAVQFVVPESFKGARVDEIPLPNFSGVSKLAILRANPPMGESLFHVADGQGRIVGLHSLEREISLKVVEQKTIIKKLERKNHAVDEDLAKLKELETAQQRVRKFLSELDLSFVCYARTIAEDGTVYGLSEDAEKRCYIEGNALNAQASKEDMLKYETFSPVVVDLQSFRDEIDWMDEDYIEEDSKTISGSSPKIFTLSALAQAYGWGIVNDNKPLKNIDVQLGATVDERKGFCHAFWRKISDVFGPVWLAENGDAGDRAAYLRDTRQLDRNVLFQAIFLQALGRLCYVMGVKADWNPDPKLLDKLELLDPKHVDYRAVLKYHTVVDDKGKPVIVADAWNEIWLDRMMKKSTNGYSFNNASENINATRHFLAEKIGLDDSDVTDEPDVGSVEVDEAA